jgi:hypothetical protein
VRQARRFIYGITDEEEAAPPLGKDEAIEFPSVELRGENQVVTVDEDNGIEVFVFEHPRSPTVVTVAAQPYVDMLLELLGRHRSRKVTQ